MSGTPCARGRGKGPDRVGLVEPDVLVELGRQHGLEVVALQLGLGPVDHADGALEPRRPQLVAHLGPAPVGPSGRSSAGTPASWNSRS